jgi:hypothetical protein
MEAHSRRGFWGGQLVVECGMWWYFLMLVSTPLPFQVLGGLTSLEFLFTRAVERALWLRAERTAVLIVGLGPLFLNLALSPIGPSLAFEPAEAGSPAAVAQAHYLHAFPGGYLTIADSSGRTEQLVIRHGSVVFAAWLVWFGLLCVFLVAAYFALVFLPWQRAGWHHSKSKLRPWLGAVMVNTPACLRILLLLACAALHINLLERSFLVFASHPVLMTAALLVLVSIVQPLSERNLNKLEFEFF